MRPSFFSILITLLMCPGVSPAQKLLFPMQPGLEIYSFRESLKKDVATALDTIRDMGFRDLELPGLYGKSAAEFRKLLDERGLRCSSFAGTYDEIQANLAQVARDAKTLGASYVVVFWINHQSPFKLADAEKAVAVFNRVGKQLSEEYGLTFAYHNHGYEFHPHEGGASTPGASTPGASTPGTSIPGTLFDYIVKNTDPRYVSFELDLLWAHFPGQDPAGLLTRYGNRFKLVHLKDLKKGVPRGDLSGKTPVTNDVALGSGQIDIRAALQAARKAGIRQYYIEDESPTYRTQIPQSIRYLRSL